jgi:HlyD family secretion protein
MKSVIRAGLLAVSFLLVSCGQNSRSPDLISGTIETDEVRVASRHGGRVKELFAQEGDSLKAGAVIAALDAAELPARRDRITAQLSELEAGPRKEEIAAAKADWEGQLANLEQARADAKRAEDLFAQKAISVNERDQAVTRAQWLEKIVAANKSRHDLLLAGTRPEQIAQVRAQLAELDTQLREMKITAPSDSVLEVLSVKVGDVLAPNQPIATLLLTNHIWVRVFAPEPWLGHLKLGDSARIRVDSFPGKDFTGIIEQINRAAEFTPRNVQTVEDRIKQVFGVKVRLENAGNELRSGMSADVVFPNVPQ